MKPTKAWAVAREGRICRECYWDDKLTVVATKHEAELYCMKEDGDYVVQVLITPIEKKRK